MGVWKDGLEKRVLGWKTKELDSDFGPVMDTLHDPPHPSPQFFFLTCASIS